jgi:hypothetical protein
MPGIMAGKMKPTTGLFLAQAEQLVKEIRPLFADKHPAVLGTVLAELVVLHFASTRPGLREQATRRVYQLRGRDGPQYETQIFPDGLPQEWQ